MRNRPDRPAAGLAWDIEPPIGGGRIGEALGRGQGTRRVTFLIRTCPEVHAPKSSSTIVSNPRGNRESLRGNGSTTNIWPGGRLRHQRQHGGQNAPRTTGAP